MSKGSQLFLVMIVTTFHCYGMSKVFFTLKSMYFKTVNKMQISIGSGLDPVSSSTGPIEMMTYVHF